MYFSICATTFPIRYLSPLYSAPKPALHSAQPAFSRGAMPKDAELELSNLIGAEV